MKAAKAQVVFFLGLPILAGFIAVFMSQWQGHHERRILIDGRENLKDLIEVQDKFYQSNGFYLPLNPASDDSETRKKLNWCVSGCEPCKFGVVVSGLAYTASVKCPAGKGTESYLGFVKTEPGKHAGLVDSFEKCRPEGVEAADTHLVNTLGPCVQSIKDAISVTPGTVRHLVVETLPDGAAIEANGIKVGVAEKNHTTLTPEYGSFYWENPTPGASKIRVSKEGYEPVDFNVDWGSFTYSAWITLRPKRIDVGNGK